RLFAALAERGRVNVGLRRVVHVWETRGGPPLLEIPARADSWLPRAFSRDGRLYAFADAARLKVWDLAGRRERLRRTDAVRSIFSLAFSPDGRSLAAANDDTTILL